MQPIYILGSTGSIGKSTLKLLRDHPHLAQVECLSAHKNKVLLLEQIKEFRPKKAFLTGAFLDKKDKLEASDFGCELCDDQDTLLNYLGEKDQGCVLLAIMGAAGLKYGLKALESGLRLAIANKEPLVIAGHLFKEKAKESGGEIIPVDSEHSAIFQCLEGKDPKTDVERIILTSSGGPFHYHSHDQFNSINPKEALKHPTWNMGQKITVDSATMINKGLEVIEAKWLFDVSIDQIIVTVHRQSIIHSMVEFIDGSMLAQLGVTDMQFPIMYAITYPERVSSDLPRLKFEDKINLSFEAVNPFLNRALILAKDCTRDDVSPVLFNAANEIFVEYFLRNEVPFVKVYEHIDKIIEAGLKENFSAKSINEILGIDNYARELSHKLLGKGL